MKNQNYKISREVFKFPYNGRFEASDDEKFSEKLCSGTIKIRKYIFKVGKLGLLSIQILSNGITGLDPSQSMGFPIFPTRPLIMRSINSNASLSIKVKNPPIFFNRPDKLVYTEPQIYESAYRRLKDENLSVEELMAELRGGGLDFDTAFKIVLGATILYMVHLNNLGVKGFQPSIRPPHHELIPEANSRPPSFGGYSSFNSRTVLGSDRINSGPDTNLIRNAYSQIPSLSVNGTDHCVTAWSVAKHSHHGPDFGMNPTDYGMTQADLDNIAEKGLINHISEGGTPPSAKYVIDLQWRWKLFAERQDVNKFGIQPVMGEQCHVVKHNRTGIFLAFKVDSGESFTGYKLTRVQSLNHNRTGVIGQNYKP